jgi:deazaflavin-dependent oxidoreductase (nitroreductase family)
VSPEPGGVASSKVVKTAIRLPVVIDAAGLGRLLGQRFVILEHEGRRTGRVYRTPLEVVRRDRARPEWIVIAAWRRRTDWLANIEHRPALALHVAGVRHARPTQRFVGVEERLDILAAYGVSHPWALRGLCRAVHWPDPSEVGALRSLAETYQLVGFRP